MMEEGTAFFPLLLFALLSIYNLNNSNIFK